MPIDLSLTGTTQAQDIRIRDAYCGKFRYKEQIEVDGVMVPNPENKQQFTRRMMRKYAVHDFVENWERSSGEKAAAAAVVVQPLE